jgi:hypothetical protein
VLLDSAGHITHVQVAIDGQWENARRAWRGDGANAIGALTSVLRTRGEFAVEVFAARESGCQTFIGVRLRDIGKDDATELLRAFLDFVVASESATLSHVSDFLSRQTGMPLFVGQPTRIEIGVVDAWVSLGARDISSAISTNAPDLRRTILNEADGLHAPAGRVIAIELAIDAHPPHWLGLEVARSTSKGVAASESIAGVIGLLGARA